MYLSNNIYYKGNTDGVSLSALTRDKTMQLIHWKNLFRPSHVRYQIDGNIDEVIHITQLTVSCVVLSCVELSQIQIETHNHPMIFVQFDQLMGSMQ